MYMSKSKALVWAQAVLERLRGLDFVSRRQPEELGLNGDLSYCYTPSGDQYLRKMLQDFDICVEDNIIDVGCGKGSAMRKMAQFPFAAVDGIELSKELAEIATANFSKLNFQQCRIFNTNAALFDEFERYNLVYFFNPFPSIVMRPVIAAIEESLLHSDRELVIIYLNPVCHSDIEANGVFKKVGWYPDHWGLTISIYTNRPMATSRLRSNVRMTLTET